MKGRLYAVGFGPGNREYMTEQAVNAIKSSDIIYGYTTYSEMLKESFPDKIFISTPMRGEEERCCLAVEKAMTGAVVSVISSGDSGIYGMAGVCLELIEKMGADIDFEIVPGITAAVSAAAMAGAPLMNDFAVISLSDLMTPAEKMYKRVEDAARAGLVICLYNPKSKKRTENIVRAAGIIKKYRRPDTVCVVVRNAGRKGGTCRLTSLEELCGEEIDMFCTVIIGNEDTIVVRGKMVTKRGYENKLLREERKEKQEESCPKIAVIAGTSEATEIIDRINVRGLADITAFAATAEGERILEKSRCRVHRGRLDRAGFLEKLKDFDAVCDASHPFATEVTETVRQVCRKMHKSYFRYERDTEGADYERAVYVSSHEEAAERLRGYSGNILLTTGSKSLEIYEKALPQKHIFARILDSEESRKKVEGSETELIFGTPPFSKEDNIELIKKNNIEVLVTKESGRRGGFDEKAAACKCCGIDMLVVKAPEQSGDDKIYTDIGELTAALLLHARLSAALRCITAPDRKFYRRTQEKWDRVAKPVRSLGRLEKAVNRIAAIERSSKVPPRKKAVMIFCGDNGVIEEGVAQSGYEVTAKCAESFVKGTATINAFAREAGADVFVYDVGMKYNVEGTIKLKNIHGTNNFLHEDAMSEMQLYSLFLSVIWEVEKLKKQGYNLIMTGEMGIGNTTAATAVLSVLTDTSPYEITGRGAGLPPERISHKAWVIDEAIKRRKPDRENVMEVLAKLGSCDIAAMAAAFVGCTMYSVPVIADGYISAVAALSAIKLEKKVEDYIFPSHISAEKGGRLALESAGLKGILDLDMCLGEGTGGVLAAKLLDFAIAAYSEACGFESLDMEQYELYDREEEK